MNLVMDSVIESIIESTIEPTIEPTATQLATQPATQSITQNGLETVGGPDVGLYTVFRPFNRCEVRTPTVISSIFNRF